MSNSKSFKKKIRSFLLFTFNHLPVTWINWLYTKDIFSKRYKINFDKTFEKLFPKGSNFKFIQIGGNDGVSFDNLFEKVMTRSSEGIILEPSQRYFSKLKENYSESQNILLLNLAIHPTDEKSILFEVSEAGLKKLPDWGRGIGSFDLNHLKQKRLNDSDIKSVKVNCISFGKLLYSYSKFAMIDYLQIDTEGFDGEILKSIDFNFFDAKMIKFESSNLEKLEFQEVMKKLKDFDFKILNDSHNTVAIKKSFRFFFK